MKLLTPLRCRLTFSLALSALALGVSTPAQTPCADVRPLLDMVSSPRSSTRIMYQGGAGAFFPEGAFYDGSPQERGVHPCTLNLYRSGKELASWPMLIQREEAVFNRFQGYAETAVHDLVTLGDYALTIVFQGEPLTTVPFSVKLKKSSDPFDPKTSVEVDSELLGWGQVTVTRGSSQRSVGLDFRLRGGDFQVPDGEDILVEIVHGGAVAYQGSKVVGRTLPAPGEWKRFRPVVSMPEGQGGGHVDFDDFVKLDGTYRVQLRHGSRVLRAFEYQVQGGALVPHPRSTFDYQPRTGYLLPRVPGLGSQVAEDLIWMEPLADPTAAAEASAGPAAVSPAKIAAWKPVTAAPGRAPSLVRTQIAARVDAHIAAGNGIVAYGTGPNTGVAYLECGVDEERAIPGGASLHSRTFFVADKKIVGLEGDHVVIFDTESGTLTPIAPEVVTLLRSPRQFTKGRHIDVDGHLVAVICDPSETADRRSVKVIDLSGPTPEVMALGFPEGAPKDLSSIAVDAAAGLVAIGSDSKDRLHTAMIAEGAPFTSFDLSGHEGFPRDCAPIVRGGRALIFDSTGTRKLRLVDLASGAVTTLAPLAKAEQWFAFDGERVALASDVSHGSGYEVRVGSVDGPAPAPPGGVGESLPSGKLGYGQRVAMVGPLVFVAGAGGGGIGSGEVLQVSDGTRWSAVLADGEPLSAVDVAAGEHMIAFKTGKSRDARVGYLLLGSGSTEGLWGL